MKLNKKGIMSGTDYFHSEFCQKVESHERAISSFIKNLFIGKKFSQDIKLEVFEEKDIKGHGINRYNEKLFVLISFNNKRSQIVLYDNDYSINKIKEGDENNFMRFDIQI